MKASPFEVLQNIYNVSVECKNSAIKISKDTNYPEHLAPICGLNMAYCPIVQCFELLDFYYHRWAIMPNYGITEENREKILLENEQRVSLIMKSTFILILSSFEAVAKQAIGAPTSTIKIRNKKRIYFIEIMNKSNEMGLISNDDLSSWEFLRELRNCLVHNNGISEKTMSLPMENGYKFNIFSGEMTQSTPRLSTLLINNTVKLYDRWCHCFLKA